jgi:hypothetical protein
MGLKVYIYRLPFTVSLLGPRLQAAATPAATRTRHRPSGLLFKWPESTISTSEEDVV